MNCIFCFACAKNRDIITMEDDMEAIESGFRFLALGDSYTIGEGVEADKSWPFQLTEKLTAMDYGVSDLRIIAKTGWTTRDLINATADIQDDNYDLVSLLIGVNNQFQNLSFDVFKNEFDLLLARAIKLNNNKEKVFVVSIPDYGVTPFGVSNKEQIALEIDMYNSYIKAQCLEQNVPFIDITTLSRLLADASDALAADRLHPSGEQYRQWVDIMLPIIVNLFE